MGISYKHFLYGALTFTSLLGALLKVTVFRDSTFGPLAYLLTLMYLAFLAWIVSELRKIHASEQQQTEVLENGVVDSLLFDEDPPDEDALIAAETYLALNENMDTICVFVNPKYPDWNLSKRQAFRQRLTRMLHQRRAMNYAAGEPPAPPEQ